MVILYFSHAIRFADNVIRRIARVAAVKLHKNRLCVRSNNYQIVMACAQNRLRSEDRTGIMSSETNGR